MWFRKYQFHRQLSQPTLQLRLLPTPEHSIKILLDHDRHSLKIFSLQSVMEKGFGFCLVQEQELLSEAFAADAALGMIEIGTITGEPHRRRGYATICCAQLIRECEARGYRTYWNCSKDNQASAGLARKLGYQTEKEFRYVVWYPPDR